MGYDNLLAERIRQLLPEGDVSERKMFGGLAFLVNGNMAVAASGQGGILVRVDPKESGRLVRNAAVTEMVMRGRSMTGWLRVSDDYINTESRLRQWVERGVAYASSLPAKRSAENP